MTVWRRTTITVVAALSLGACHGGAPSTRALRPPHEQPVVVAGADRIPPHAQLSVDVTHALAQGDPGRHREHRQLYLASTDRALGLTRRYIDKPYSAGRFLVTDGHGPTAGVLGRAAAALTLSATSLDVAVLNAATVMRAPTLRLRTDLIRLGDSLRRGNTVGSPDHALLQSLVAELVRTGTSNRFKLRAAKAPAVTPVTVIPAWKVARKTRISAARRQINVGMGALRRYLLAPARRGAFSATATSRSRLRAEHRAFEALRFAGQQWSAAASRLGQDPQLTRLIAELGRQQRALIPLLTDARRGALRTAETATITVAFGALVQAGAASRVRLRPSRSPTFLP